MTAIEYALAAAVLLLLLPYFSSLLTFAQNHLLKRSTITEYRLSSRSYALVTGASDGIGKGVARELVKQGFNVVIHGRNREKLASVKKELQALGKGTDVRILVGDAGEENVDWVRIAKELEGLEITVLVNNAGGMPIPPVPFDEQPYSSIESGIRLNAMFPLRLTHLLLGPMRSLPGPTAVLFIGSIASELPPPYMEAYACSKSFLQTLARSIAFDERRLLHSRVQVHYVQTANVKTHNGVHETNSWDTPGAESYGRAVVRIVGCGSREVCPWWVHAVQRWVVYSMGEWMAENVLLMAMPKPKTE
ncbi:NADP-binding protein [Dacryopinax primogenitus]|uniref:NADP-binding protein n=1 Tax=Dacryopinax primogenitus (strain DJM 731) TaxID=1858805 RepID=M5GER4_DACPD|nr:NADP-binding protein [Dacryopinax primogenitus]EJU03508.1 NADP-binding protein [Dacryopinax primogenitus]